ncbi:ABC transporter permease [Mucilaginibacter phyllosphaerae]|uniref:ABC transport system permease protein n=1 Tax=Mucilaginibacter phyllosphaerae TaxID=1812349 RepID=A0A4Y8A756_9SPHI|nr:ABC transporter permease [Mucilaginibacter phyllosphaerae]MBB3970845.1 putative ABC transport system permease protein [Mucilaginibacter phyllosphaerae]TEW64219.1 ABC transporter permease [Mucilaginibacter phyllosphaerae]GGH04948.1 ABC transporter permease [Mucilaginibacter phyllosphaerae]
MDFYLTALLQGLCFAGIAFGIYISMKIFNIPDITTDGSYTLGGVVSGAMLTHNLSGYLILPAVLLAGALAGALTGIIHTKLKINALLAGILVMTALYSVNLTILGRSNLPLLNMPNLFTLITFTTNINQNSLIILTGFVLVFTLLIGYLLKTDFGIAMRATGNSEPMIRALGVNTDRMKITGLALANALTALSGYLIVQLQGFADISMGIGIVIVGLGSVIIAETIINWLRITSVWWSLVLVMAGAVIFQFVLAFTLNIGIDANLLKLVTAVFVLLIVGLPRLTGRQA